MVEDCTVAAFFNAIENGKPFYISGASVIFDHNPVLHDMIDNEQVRSIGLFNPFCHHYYCYYYNYHHHYYYCHNYFYYYYYYPQLLIACA